MLSKGGRRIRTDAVRIKGIRQDKLLTGPRSIAIGISRKCNLYCQYCLGKPFDDVKPGKKIRGKSFIDLNDFIKIVDDCSDLGVERITLCGGEPTLHPDLKDMIAYVRSKKMQVSINTNGIFDGKLREHFKFVSLVNINISATHYKDYEKLQGGSRQLFNKVLQNIKFIAKHKNTSGHPIINIVYVLNRHNFIHAENIIGLAKKIGADSIEFKIMRFNKRIKDLAILDEDSRKLNRVVQAILKKGRHRTIKTNLDQICRLILDSRFRKDCKTEKFSGTFQGDLYFHRTFRKDFKCYYGWFSADIGPWGHVFLCCTNRLTYIGNIYEQSIKEIWNSPQAHKARLAMKHTFDIRKQCWKPCHYCTQVGFNNAVDSIVSPSTTKKAASFRTT